MKSQDNRKSVPYRFDSFCKMVLKGAKVDIQRGIITLGEHEVELSEISEREMADISVTDKYFANEYVFSVLGESVGVSDVDLAEALNALPADKREIVLMAYFFDMTDREIGEAVNLARRTVGNRRHKSLQELKKHMEE